MPLSGFAQSASANDSTYLVYIGTYTSQGSKGIYAFRFDAADGNATPLGLAAVTDDPSFLAADGNHRLLYAVNELGSFQGKRAGAVSVFAIDRTTGKLELLNQVSSGGPGPAHLELDMSGHYLLVANYDGGSVAVMPVESDGRLAEHTSFIQSHGSSVNKKRQEAPHAHQVVFAGDNRFVFVPDLGTDKLMVYRFDSEKGSLAPGTPESVSVEPGSGPRHVALAGSGKYVYLLNELTATVMVFAFDSANGSLHLKQTVPTLPKGFSGENTAAEIVVDKTGRHLYVSNRGADSLTVFTISPSDGTLSEVQSLPTGGKTPRNFAIDPTGRWLFAANQDSNDIVLFRVDPETGKLAAAGKKLQVPTPVCIIFIPAK